MKRRILSILCALALCLSLLPAAALADGLEPDAPALLDGEGASSYVTPSTADGWVLHENPSTWFLGSSKRATYTQPFRSDIPIEIDSEATLEAPSITVEGTVHVTYAGHLQCTGELTATVLSVSANATVGTLSCETVSVSSSASLTVTTQWNCTGNVTVNGTLYLPAGTEPDWNKFSGDGTVYIGDMAYDTAGKEQGTGMLRLTPNASASGKGYDWDANTCTLTLNGFNRTYGADAEGGIYVFAPGEDVTLVLQGNNVMVGLSADSYAAGIFCEGSGLTLQGNGSLSCEGSAGALEFYGGSIQLADGYSLDEGVEIYNMSGQGGMIVVAGPAETGLIPATSFTIVEDEIAIDETHFPDEAFRQFIQTQLSQFADGDGTLSLDERERVQSFLVGDRGIQSLQGIEYFPNLVRLECYDNQLTTLDVSRNTELTTLYCYDNQLTTLDVSSNTELTSLDCSGNQLTTLDVSSNTELTSLSCSGNQLTTLDVSSNTELTSLSCSGNQLTTLDVSSNTELTFLYCSGNQLTTLDVRSNTELEELGCDDNNLTALDVRSNPALTTLYCYGNQLTTLDVSSNPALTTLYCSGNKLTTLGVSSNPALEELGCDDNNLTALDVSSNTALGYLDCSGNKLTQLDLSSNTRLDEEWVDCSGQSLAKTGTASGDGWTLDLSNLVDDWGRVSNVTATGGALLAEDGKTVTWPAGAEAPAVTYQYATGVEGHTMDVTIHLEEGPSITRATVTLDANRFTYDGNEHKPTVTVKLGEDTLIENTDYTVFYDGDTTNAGTVTVTVTGKGTYGGKATASYTIDPAALTITGVTLAAKTYDGTKTATVESVTFNEFTLVKDRDYTAAAVYDSADAGTDRTATVTVTLKSGNYTLENSTYTLENQTIEKAEFGGTTEVTGTVLAGYPGSVNLPAIPGDASYGTPNASADLTGLSIADGVLSYTGGESITVGQEYTITVPVSSVNYEDYDITVTLTGTDKQTLTITGVTAQDGTYNGQAQTGYTGTPSAQGYTGDFTVTYNTADQKAPINAGEYTVTIAIPDSESQYTGSITLDFTVAKAAVTVTAPSLTIQVGEAIPDLSALSCSITGLVGSDAMWNVALAYEGTPDSSQTGSYAIVPSGGAFTSGSADNYNVQYGNGTLTIREKEPEIYTVSFDANGGSGQMADQAFTFGVPQALAANAFTRTGYTFAGWNTKADGTGTAYGDRDTLTIGAADLTLYAQWKANTYTVSFDANGGSGRMADQAFTFGVPQALAANTFTRSGYTFTGWNTKADGSGTAYGDRDTLTIGVADLTLYAQWTKKSSGSDSDHDNETETDKNPDGSTTTTVTKPDGSTTETTKWPDGSKEVVETDKNGTVTTTTTDKNGNQTEVVEHPDGSAQTTVDNKDGSSSITTVDENGKTEAEVKLPATVVEDAQEKGEAVALPMPSVSASSDWDEAPTVTVDLPSGSSAKVEIPVERVTPGTVAVIVKADGTEEIIKTSLTTENGVAVTLSDGDTVKLVDNSKTFVDVPASYWGSEYIDFASSRELFTGTGSTTFSPDASMTRGMIVTVLASLDGADTSSAGGAWYEAGRQWAVANGISDGTNMEGSLTREQLAVMLWSYAGQPAAGSLSGYTDAASVSDWTAQAMAWCVEQGVISGMDGGLNPQGTATRAQVATMLMQFIKTMEQ